MGINQLEERVKSLEVYVTSKNVTDKIVTELQKKVAELEERVKSLEKNQKN